MIEAAPNTFSSSQRGWQPRYTMSSKRQLIVLTENYCLYAGLKALFPEMHSYNLNFGEAYISDVVEYGSKMVVVVDSLIFLSGKWKMLSFLIKRNPDATLVWLSQKETGNFFPVARNGDRVISLKQDPLTIRRVILETKKNLYPQIAPIILTKEEFNLLPLFVSGVSLPKLSKLMKCSVKTLYRQRKSILNKSGFRSMAFFHNIYIINYGRFGERILKDFFISEL